MRVSLGQRDGARPGRMEGQSPLDGEMGHGSLEWRGAATLSLGQRDRSLASRTEEQSPSLQDGGLAHGSPELDRAPWTERRGMALWNGGMQPLSL